ncbi:MAG: hypothetical protein ACYCW6_06610 [Candidatus Xenobia bacterium]
MDRIWKELNVVKAMQESDFQATMLGFQSLFELMQRHYESQQKVTDKLEEGLRLLDHRLTRLEQQKAS